MRCVINIVMLAGKKNLPTNCVVSSITPASFYCAALSRKSRIFLELYENITNLYIFDEVSFQILKILVIILKLDHNCQHFLPLFEEYKIEIWRRTCSKRLNSCLMKAATGLIRFLRPCNLS